MRVQWWIQRKILFDRKLLGEGGKLGRESLFSVRGSLCLEARNLDVSEKLGEKRERPLVDPI